MEQSQILLFEDTTDIDIPSWKRLEGVMYKWAVMSKHYEQLEKYENLREQYR